MLHSLDQSRRDRSCCVYTQAKSLINKRLEALIVVDCRRGYKRVNLCIRQDLYRALRFLEASSGLRRFEIINEALELYLLNYNTIKRLGVDGVRRVLEQYSR